jgi:hypothetical protein
LIDGRAVKLKSAMSLPYWLNAGQSISPSSNVAFLSAIEFTKDSLSNALKFGSVVKISGSSTVPAGKTWKVEAVAFDTLVAPNNNGTFQLPSNSGSINTSGAGSSSNLPVLYQSPKKFSSPGTYQFVVPPGVTNICIEVWGGGGNGGSPFYNFSYPPGGGSGGGYGYQCFTVIPGASYTVTVGGAEVAGLILATGGISGNNAGFNPPILVLGGTSSATFNVNGGPGLNGISSVGGSGGYSYNGGNGGIGTNYQQPGNGFFPGGGGGAVYNPNGGASFGKGADGQVIIYW